MKRLKRIDIIFENSETASIPAKYIGKIKINQIRPEIARIFDGSICEYDISHSIMLELKPQARNIPVQPVMNDGTDKNLFRRLESYSDITALECFCDDSEDGHYIMTEWTDDEMSQAINKNQYILESKSGSLVIFIGKNYASQKKLVRQVVDDLI